MPYFTAKKILRVMFWEVNCRLLWVMCENKHSRIIPGMQALYVRNDKIIIKVETYAHSTCHRAQRLPSVVVLCVIYSLYTDFLDSISSQTQTASETNLKFSMPKLLQYILQHIQPWDSKTTTGQLPIIIIIIDGHKMCGCSLNNKVSSVVDK